MSQEDRHKYHLWAKDWLIQQKKNARKSLDHLIPVTYESGHSITCMDKTFTLSITREDRSSSGARVKGETIFIKLNNQLNGLETSEAVRTLLSRVMAKLFKDQVEHRLRLINDKYFGHEVKSVRLKYNRSNWGSCSSTKNINLSTRLLMAPEWVRDYVIVHELAHMNEMNHSAKYWKIVEKVYPNYKNAEQWLKVNGNKCDFLVN